LIVAATRLEDEITGESDMRTMTAVMKKGVEVVVAPAPRPIPRTDDDVVVRVVLAGICRTDVYVAEGRLGQVPDPLILGHEFSGIVDGLGPACGGLRQGDRVAVFPLIPCLDCVSCGEGRQRDCLRGTMLGVDRDGAFAELVVVPARCVYRMPEGMSFSAAAYAEPVAAALAVLNAGIQTDQSGLVYGRNRFAVLVQRILEAHGFERVTVFDPRETSARLKAHAFDFVIETSASGEALSAMIGAARPRGTIVLKSRQPWPAAIDLLAAIPKELTFRAVNYAPFERALSLLAEGELRLDDLLGPVYPLDQAISALAEAGRGESNKVFLAPAGDHVWHR
jgi:L-iditol 2-dehydrogenase